MNKPSATLVSEAVEGSSVAILVTEAGGNDHPIVFVNEAFTRVTGYAREEVQGRNCRFLQGSDTESAAVEKIREGLASGEPFQVTLTNYRADGTPFLNHLMISPVSSPEGEITAYLGAMRVLGSGSAGATEGVRETDLLQELQHRVKNHLSMVVSMIRLQAARPVSEQSMRALGRRVEALALLYEEMFEASQGRSGSDRIHTGAYLSRIAHVVSRLSGNDDIRVDVECDDIDLTVDRSARLGLLLSELLTNALEHAFEGRDSGRISVRFHELSDGVVRLTVEDDGIGLPEGSNWPYGARSVERQSEVARNETGKLDTTGNEKRPGVGGTIILSLTQTLGATLDVNRNLHGTTVTVDFERSGSVDD